MRRTNFVYYLAFMALFCGASPVLAQTAVAPDLGAAATFAALGTNTAPTIGTVTCTDSGPGTGVTGNVGTTFNGGITNSCTISGAITSPVSSAVTTAFTSARSAMDTQNPNCTGTIPTTSTTLAPGVYCSAAGTTIGAGVVITLSGNASDVWVFRVGTGGPGALTLTNAQVVMGGSALACNVYWRTSAGATITDSTFNGTVLSGAAVTQTRGSWNGRAMATTDVTLTDPAPLSFAGCAAPATITVNKDFIPNNASTVPVALTCTSGAITTTPLNASEATAAVFRVGGANLTGTTCTATETVPASYTANQAGCVGVALNGSCTITNTLSNAELPADAPTTPPAGCPAIGLTPVTIPNGKVGVAYSQQFSGSGGTAPYVYSTVANTLPAGLTFTAGGLLSGTPTSSIPQTFKVRATDSVGCFTERTYSFVFDTAVPTLPQVFAVMLGFGLLLLGYLRLQRRRSAA